MQENDTRRKNTRLHIRQTMTSSANRWLRRHFNKVIKHLLPLLMILFSISCAFGENSRPIGRMVIVVAGGMSIRDVADPSLSYLFSLLSKGSCGLMNIRTGRPNNLLEPALTPGMEAECVSLGAGAMAIGGAESRYAANAFEQLPIGNAAQLYLFRTGTLPGQSQVLHTEIARIRRANESAAYRAVPGMLGTTLRKAKLRVAVIGNSDKPGELHREITAIVMDDTGRIDFGDVGSAGLFESDAGSPYGIRTNISTVLSELDNFLRECRLVVIDFGDTFRADSYAVLCTDMQAAHIRKQAIRRLDKFLAKLSERLDFNKDALLLVSPSSRMWSDLDQERLTPVIAVGRSFGKGVLGSPSTRTPGMVTICDFAPTILRFFGIDAPLEMVGRPMTIYSVDKPLDHLLVMNLNASLQGQRQPAMRGASVAQSVLVTAVTLIALLGVASPLKRIAGWAALTPAVLPLVMLYLPLIHSGGLVGAALWLIALTPVCVVICKLVFRSPTRALIWLCALIVISLLADLACGAPLISSSIAGYSMIEGARYYGIGNELAGTLIGAALVGVGLGLSSRKKQLGFSGLIALCTLVMVFIGIGSPGLGANAGAAASAAPAIVTALLARRGWKPNLKSMAIVLSISITILGIVFAADVLRGGGSQSHIGRAMGLAARGNVMSILVVAQRKLMLNFMLLSTSVWSRLLGLSLLCSVILYWHGRRVLGDKLLTKETNAAALGCCVATVCAFLFNDSGVLAAAACSVFLWMLLALRSLEDGKHRMSSKG